MAAVVRFQQDWPQTTFYLNIPLSVHHTMRVLKRHGGRLVESAPECVRYAQGDITFTVHHFVEGDKAFNLFADNNGWALHESTLLKLVEEGVFRGDFSE